MAVETGRPAPALEATVFWRGTALERVLVRRGAVDVGPGTQLPSVALARGHRLADLGPACATLYLPPDARLTGATSLAVGEEATVAVGELDVRLRCLEAAPERVRAAPPDFAFARRLALVAILGTAFGAAVSITPRTLHLLSDPLAAKPPRLPPPRVTKLPVSFARPAPARVREPGSTESGGAIRTPGSGPARRARSRVSAVGLLVIDDMPAAAGVFGGGLPAAIDGALDRLGVPGAADAAGGLSGLGIRGLSGGGPDGLGIGGLGTGGRPGGPDPFGPRGLGPKGPGPKVEAIRIVDPADGLPKDVIYRIIRQNDRQVRSCYERELQRGDPSVQGKLAVQFVIDGTGRVAEVEIVEDAVGSPELAACVRDRIGRWTFPAPAGGGTVIVGFPWVFRSAGG